MWSLSLLPFWALILVWFFPWTVFLPASIMAAGKNTDSLQRPLIRLIIAWTVVILGFFSVSGRLEHYSFPVLPALSLLVALALTGPWEGVAIKWAFRGLALIGLAALMAGIGAGIWYAVAGLPAKTTSAEPTSIIYETDFSILSEMPAEIMQRLIPPAAVTVLILSIGFFAALWLETRRKRMAALLCVTVVMAGICGMIHWSFIICEDMISSKKFGLAVAREARPGDHLVVLGDYESINSINFYEPLRVEVLDGLAYAITPGMKFKDAPRILLTDKQFREIWNNGERVFAIVPRNRLVKLGLGGTEMLEVLDRVLIKNR